MEETYAVELGYVKGYDNHLHPALDLGGHINVHWSWLEKENRVL